MSPTDDYENLTAEQREAKDKEDKAREDAEQATLPFSWKQELKEVDIEIPLPSGTRVKDVIVKLQKKHLSVGLKGQEPILDGELCQGIKVEDSVWSFDDGVVGIHLEKLADRWWENVLTHHPKVDTRKIQPANSKLSDLDGETRGMVEKMMFDNQQKQLGKPTSDEMKKMDAIKKFQAAHPELDFSKAKIS